MTISLPDKKLRGKTDVAVVPHSQKLFLVVAARNPYLAAGEAHPIAELDGQVPKNLGHVFVENQVAADAARALAQQRCVVDLRDQMPQSTLAKPPLGTQ
jgi:hypothetical protein